MFQFLFYNDQLFVTFNVIRRMHVKLKYFARRARSTRRNTLHFQSFASAFAFAFFHSSFFIFHFSFFIFHFTNL